MEWIRDAIETAPGFLRQLKGKKRPGFFHYSLTGDYIGERVTWGLGNAVFFLKIAYTLHLEEEFRQEIQDARAFVRSFEHHNGLFYDPLVQVLAAPRRLMTGAHMRSLQETTGQFHRLGETRQAISALRLYDPTFFHEYQNLPNTKEGVLAYCNALDWSRPWHAGAQWSILVFLLQFSIDPGYRLLVPSALAWIESVAHEDGFWHRGTPTLAEKINGAMKVMTGMQAANSFSLPRAQALVDGCLLAEHDRQACDLFNIVYALAKADAFLKHSYRHGDIVAFMQHRLGAYHVHYHEKIGGFSFFPHQANRWYYGAPISRGKNEPDIHGTVLFLWGISLITAVLGTQEELGLKEFLT